MSKTITILSVIDVETILENKATTGTISDPVYLGDWSDSNPYVKMLVNEGFIDCDDELLASSELKIEATNGDTIQWEVTSPGSGLQYNAVIANIIIGTQPSPPSLTKPKPVLKERHIFDKAGVPSYQVVQQTHFTTTVLNDGTTQYVIVFQIMSATGKNLGYYMWIPFVNILGHKNYEKAYNSYLKIKDAFLV